MGTHLFLYVGIAFPRRHTQNETYRNLSFISLQLGDDRTSSVEFARLELAWTYNLKPVA